MSGRLPSASGDSSCSVVLSPVSSSSSDSSQSPLKAINFKDDISEILNSNRDAGTGPNVVSTDIALSTQSAGLRRANWKGEHTMTTSITHITTKTKTKRSSPKKDPSIRYEVTAEENGHDSLNGRVLGLNLSSFIHEDSDDAVSELPVSPSSTGSKGLVAFINSRYHADARAFAEVVYRDEYVPLKTAIRHGFLPGVPLEIRILSRERSLSHKFNPLLYTIEVVHGSYRWVIRKRYHHFRKLHTSLFMYRTKQVISGHGNDATAEVVPKNACAMRNSLQEKPEINLYETLPPLTADGKRREAFAKLSRERGNSIFIDTEEERDHATDFHNQSSQQSQGRQHLPRFPKKPDSLLHHDEEEERQQHLEDYLRNLVKSETYRNHHETLEFFEVSEYSFVQDMVKFKEGLVRKRTGDDYASGWRKFVKCLFLRKRWRKMWLVLQESYIFGINPKTGEVRVVLLFDRDENLPVDLKIGKCFLKRNLNDSFAPLRSSQTARWYVDGESYMAAVHDVILAAREEIFITDWWLSPEIYLKRGKSFSPESRLDSLLKKKAEEGVRIFILLYKEMQMALGLNSYYSKRALISRGGKNVKVFRHPNHSGTEFKNYLWAHHEKLVVVDQMYAFVGGIDLCYGRWDTNLHPLIDLPPSDLETLNEKKPSVVGALPSYSTRQDPSGGSSIAHMIRSAHEVTVAPIRGQNSEDERNQKTLLDAVLQKRRVLGGTSFQESRDVDKDANGDYFDDEHVGKIERLRRAVATAKRRLRRKQSQESGSDEAFSSSEDEYAAGVERRKSRKRRPSRFRRRGLDNPLGVSDDFAGPGTGSHRLQTIAEPDPEKETPGCLWRGKDYVNFIVKDVARPEEPEGDNVDRRTTPRMPWHDIAVMVQGQAARDTARHFIQRWNAIKTEKAKFNKQYPFLLPKSYENVDVVPDILDTMSSNVDCQVLRSVCDWSAGLATPENSIQVAMVNAISEAQHYIYMENQFYITSAGDQSEVKNAIGAALVRRIVKAHKNNEMFRVYVLIPLLPAFEGKIGSATGNALRMIMHYNYASISRGPNSICRRLENLGIDPNKYINFTSLRTHAKLSGCPVTELIYIHSKLMIVDDRLVICGSANINDRSLLGERDSEVCLLLKDRDFTSTRMNRKPFRSGCYAGSLRRFLMREHLGLLNENKELAEELVMDPVCEHFYKEVWLRTAALNTKHYDDAFLVVPTDAVTTIEELQRYEQRRPIAEIDYVTANRILKQIRGNLVLLPLHFLEAENLNPPLLAKENMVPTMTWT